MNTLLTNERIALRALEPTDLDLLYEWENDATLWNVSDTIAPYSRQMLWQYLENYTGDIYLSRELRLMAVDTESGEAMGTVDLFNFHPLNNRAELGLYISESYRGKGLGIPMLDLVCAYCRDHLGLRQIYVYIGVDNASCRHLFEQYGFTRVGLLKDWVKRGSRYTDVELLQLLLA